MSRRMVLGAAGALILIGVVATAPTAGADNGGADARESMKVELGRRLFFDPALGRRGRIGCADCHQPEKGFSDPRVRSDDEDRTLLRHSQPTVDLGGEGFHWDGEFLTVRDLIDSRILPAEEAKRRADARDAMRVAATKASGAGHASDPRDARPSIGGYAGERVLTDTVVERMTPRATPVAVRLAEDGRYDEGFRAAFGDAAITATRIGDALEAYLGSLRTAENALDRFLAGRADALTEQQKRGLELFRGKANCSQCHALDGKDGRAALTDGKFHDTGVGFAPPGTVDGVDIGGVMVPARVATPGSDSGRGGTTHLTADDHAFKTPGLRDVTRRGPYMHDGSLATLADVVAYYDRGGTPNPNLDARIKRLALSAQERGDLVAFLGALTAYERAGLGEAPRSRCRTLRLTIRDLEGRALPRLAVTVIPCGDRLRGTDAMPAPFDVVTEADGTVAIPFPLSTHIRLGSTTHEIGLSRPIPDCAAPATLVATPRSIVSVRIRRAARAAELPASILATRVVVDPGDGFLLHTRSQSWTLTRVGQVSPVEAIYTSPADRDSRGTLVELTSGRAGESFGLFELDVFGGASETIDLERAERLHPELPSDFFEHVFHTPELGGETGR